MLSKSLVNIGLRVNYQQNKRIQGVTAGWSSIKYAETHRRDASSTTTSTSTMTHNTKLKTMDDLGGPSFMTTLYWLFVKGYFQTTQQLQVSLHKG